MVVAHLPAVVHTSPTPTAVHQKAHPAPYGWQVHVVRRGESVAVLAVTYRTTISAIVARNHLTGHGRLIQPGQELQVPRTTPLKSARPAKPAKPAPTPRRTYVVRSGDTLSQIAFAQKVPLATVLKLNKLGMRSIIYPGQRITLPAAPRPVTTKKAVGPRRLGVKEVPRTQVKAMIIATARKHGVDPKLALAIGWQESGWQQNVLSSADAYGIMQVIPSSGEWASSMVGRSLDLRKPQDNVTAGVVILRALGRMSTDRDQAIAGYYQGLGSVRAKGMYTDTKQYVRSVNAILKRM